MSIVGISGSLLSDLLELHRTAFRTYPLALLVEGPFDFFHCCTAFATYHQEINPNASLSINSSLPISNDIRDIIV